MRMLACLRYNLAPYRRFPTLSVFVYSRLQLAFLMYLGIPRWRVNNHLALVQISESMQPKTPLQQTHTDPGREQALSVATDRRRSAEPHACAATHLALCEIRN